MRGLDTSEIEGKFFRDVSVFGDLSAKEKTVTALNTLNESFLNFDTFSIYLLYGI